MRRLLTTLRVWFDSWAVEVDMDDPDAYRIDWLRVRQGFFWWEIDITFYLLKVMSWLGLIWKLTPVPEKARRSGLVADGAGR